MKKILLSILFLVCGCSSASYDNKTTNETPKPPRIQTRYVNTYELLNFGTTTKVYGYTPNHKKGDGWILYNYENLGISHFHYYKSDCKGYDINARTLLQLEEIVYSKLNKEGNAIRRTFPNTQERVIPGSIGESIYDFICNGATAYIKPNIDEMITFDLDKIKSERAKASSK